MQVPLLVESVDRPILSLNMFPAPDSDGWGEDGDVGRLIVQSLLYVNRLNYLLEE